MKDLLEAFQIFFKYMSEVKHPTHCEHDELTVMCDPDKVSEEDIKRLEELGFHPNSDDRHFYSFRFGSA